MARISELLKSAFPKKIAIGFGRATPLRSGAA
jgi:hypothetical protein